MDRLRVLTLNIWNRQGPWEKRLALIRRGIERLRPDLVGLQEVLRLDGGAQAGAAPSSQAGEIAAGLGYEEAYGSAWEIGGGLHFGNAALSRFPIVRHETFALPTGSEEPRALLHVEVEAPCGRVPLFVTHFNWKFHQGDVRQEQAAAVAERIAAAAPVENQGERYPPILCGDFNAEPASDEIRFFRGWHAIGGRTVYFADCFDVAGDGGPGHTFARRNPFAAQAREPSRRIDYVFVRGPDRRGRGEPLACRVVLDEDEDGVFPSDHFGVYAELSVR